MRNIASIILLFAFAHTTVLAQSLADTSIGSNVNMILQERMFVHIDRSDYVAGDILWMKIYNTDAYSRKPSPFSKVAYIEVLDRMNNPVLQTKVELIDGSGAGSMFIPVTIATGNYLVRGYTAWMKNSSPHHFFHQAVTIVNTQKEYKPDTTISLKPLIAFFPESGTLINNIESVVAFRAIDGSGKGMQFTATLMDEANRELLYFQPAAFGIGRFHFTPTAGHHYHAVLKTADGMTLDAPLPAVKQSGFTIRATEEAGTLQLQAIGLPANDKSAVLVIHAANRPVASYRVNLMNGQALVPVDLKMLKEGVNTITLFNDEKQAVAERLYFRAPLKHPLITATVDQPLHAQRERVAIQLGGTLAGADLSASVYKLKPGAASTQDIVAGLWLGTELHGTIESPSAYFAVDRPASLLIDNLMLTHGYRKLTADNGIEHPKTTLRYAPELEGPIMEGLVTNSRTGQPAKAIPVYLSITGMTPKFYASTSDSNGVVRFLLKNYYGNGELIVQNDYRLDSIYKVELRSPFADPEQISLLPYRLNAADEPWLSKAGLAVQVQNAVHAERLRTFSARPVDTLMFYNTPGETYWLDDYKRFTTMEEVLREYVPGVAIRRRSGKLAIDVVNYTMKTMFEDPLLLLDGVPIFNSETLLRYDPLKVRKLEVVNNRYVLGSAVFNGISSFQTYKGDLDGFVPDPRAIVIDYEGLQLQRQFYSPVYETIDQRNSRTPDYRNLLHWSPFVKIESSANNRFSFYTSDQPGTYLVVVQGIDAEGIPESTQATFEVK